jgi:hypothetical protein
VSLFTLLPHSTPIACIYLCAEEGRLLCAAIYPCNNVSWFSTSTMTTVASSSTTLIAAVDYDDKRVMCCCINIKIASKSTIIVCCRKKKHANGSKIFWHFLNVFLSPLTLRVLRWNRKSESWFVRGRVKKHLEEKVEIEIYLLMMLWLLRFNKIFPNLIIQK